MKHILAKNTEQCPECMVRYGTDPTVVIIQVKGKNNTHKIYASFSWKKPILDIVFLVVCPDKVSVTCQNQKSFQCGDGVYAFHYLVLEIAFGKSCVMNA